MHPTPNLLSFSAILAAKRILAGKRGSVTHGGKELTIINLQSILSINA
ncbi:hypothetical protein SynSYN20_00855 [Synechococcus sp. SYN20]|nr:hypothetical protein SynSYN20_00855 [Synechococcus sp. SYN20]